VSSATRLAAGALAVVVLTPLLAFMASGSPPPPVPASITATADIPQELLPVYQEAAAACALPWQVLAAVAKVASDHGRATPAGGLMGPLPPLAQPAPDPAPAVRSAAAQLCAAGATDPARLPAALAALNPGLDVARVLAVADSYRADRPATPPAP
jgi:hypothetical protein